MSSSVETSGNGFHWAPGLVQCPTCGQKNGRQCVDEDGHVMSAAHLARVEFANRPVEQRLAEVDLWPHGATVSEDGADGKD